MSALGTSAARGSLRQSALLIGSYAAVLCWIGAGLLVASIPGIASSLGWFFGPPAVLTLVVWVVWLQGRERPPRREPQHLRGRHTAHASAEPVPPPPRSVLSRSLLIVSMYTAALIWGGLLALAWNGDAYALGPAILVVPLFATLLAVFAWAYRGGASA